MELASIVIFPSAFGEATAAGFGNEGKLVMNIVSQTQRCRINAVKDTFMAMVCSLLFISMTP